MLIVRGVNVFPIREVVSGFAPEVSGHEFPAWAEEYMTRMETTLGDDYSEPVADVRGYIASVKSQNG